MEREGVCLCRLDYPFFSSPSQKKKTIKAAQNEIKIMGLCYRLKFKRLAHKRSLAQRVSLE